MVFVEAGKQQFVVKELNAPGAQREVENYLRLLERGIHTLVPVGYVIRREAPIPVTTRVGHEYEPNVVGHTVTQLLDRVLPDSLLYRRAFTVENRKRIWDAIVNLFVELHSRGVYWGDASLANTLVKFLKVEIPYVGKRTELKAFLADAETVEIHDSLLDSMRIADLQFFLESMDWINEDLRASGVLRDELATGQDKAYLQTQYEKMYTLALRQRTFEKASTLNIGAYLGAVCDPIYFETHEYYLSQAEGKDVGIIRAMRAYASQFGTGEHWESFWNQLANKLRDLLGVSGRTLLGVFH